MWGSAVGSTIFTSGPCRNRLNFSMTVFTRVQPNTIPSRGNQSHIPRLFCFSTQFLLSLDSVHLGHIHVRTAYEAHSRGRRDVFERGQEGAQYSTWALCIQKFRKKKKVALVFNVPKELGLLATHQMSIEKGAALAICLM